MDCPQEAEDVVQEAYLRILEKGSVERIENLPAYVKRVTENLLVDRSRRPENSPHTIHLPLEDDLACPAPAPDQRVAAHQELDVLYQRINELPPQCREVFLLHKVEQLSYAEIAERLRISPRTVENHIAKALRRLRDHSSAR